MEGDDTDSDWLTNFQVSEYLVIVNAHHLSTPRTSRQPCNAYFTGLYSLTEPYSLTELLALTLEHGISPPNLPWVPGGHISLFPVKEKKRENHVTLVIIGRPLAPLFSTPKVEGDELDIREALILTRSLLQAELGEICVNGVIAQRIWQGAMSLEMWEGPEGLRAFHLWFLLLLGERSSLLCSHYH